MWFDHIWEIFSRIEIANVQDKRNPSLAWDMTKMECWEHLKKNYVLRNEPGQQPTQDAESLRKKNALKVAKPSTEAEAEICCE